MSSIDERCALLHGLMNALPRSRYPFEEKALPLNGIYVIFEKGERSHGADRMVRVGTHTGNDQLRSRLMQHFATENKDRSIFRKNIGRAIINRDGDVALLAMWEKDRTTRKGKEESKGFDMEAIAVVEGKVSRYMRENLSFAAFRVDGKDERLALESKLISTVSLCKTCGPSQPWLGRFYTKQKIRESGLWLVNELGKEPLSDGELEGLEKRLGTGAYK